MTQKSLGAYLFPEKREKNAAQLINFWCKGERLGSCTPEMVIKISKATGATLDELYGI